DLKHIELPMDVYRVVLPWQEFPGAASSENTAFVRASERKRRRALLALGAFLLLVLMVGLKFFARTGDRGAVSGATSSPLASSLGLNTNAAPSGQSVRTNPITSLAVLPLVNLSHDPDQEYFVDGITELLCTELASLSALKKVTSRTTVMQFKKTTKTI